MWIFIFAVLGLCAAENIISLNVTQGSVMGGIPLLVSGSGFSSSLSYSCSFASDFWNLSSSATWKSSQSMTCVSPPVPTDSEGAEAAFSLASSSGAIVPSNLKFLFIPQWTALSVTESPATGGTVLTVSGLGFTNSSLSYSCSFSGVFKVAAYSVRRTSMLCLLPVWGSIFPGQYSSFSLTHAAIGDVPGTAAQSFLFTEEWFGPDVNGTYSLGGNSLQISGTGFNITETYSCVFASNATRTVLTSPSVYPSDPTKVVCVVPDWGSVSTAGVVNLTLAKSGGGVLRRAGPAVTFSFVPGWIQIIPTVGHHAGGTSLTVTGSGFDLTSNYSCLFSIFNATAGASVQLASTSTAAISRSKFNCVVPAFPLVLGSKTSEIANVSVVATAGSVSTIDKIGAVGQLQVYQARVSPLSLPCDGGSTFLIETEGLEACGRNYTCRFQSGNVSVDVSDVSIPSSNYIGCIVPTWGDSRAAGTVSLTVLRNNAVVGAAAPLVFSVNLAEMFSYSSAFPTKGLSLGGTTIQVYGSGFDVSATYFCRFFGPLGYLDGSVRVKTLFTLLCAAPAWGSMFPAGKAKMSVVRSTDGSATDPGSIKGVTFEFLEIWQAAIGPTIGGALGGTVIPITGSGFDFTGGYRYYCQFAAETSSGLISVDSVSVIPSNSRTVTCTTPAWGSLHPAVSTTVTLRRFNALSDSVIPGTSAYFSFSFSQQWISISTRLAAASGGNILTVTGTGFDSADSTYFCRFQNVAGEIVDSTRVQPSSSSSLLCSLPPWGSSYAAGTLRFELVQFDKSISPASQVDTSFSVFELVTSLLSPVLITDPILLPLSGFGFSSSRTYPCVFSDGVRSLQTTAVVSSPTLMYCPLAPWGQVYGAGQIQLTVTYTVNGNIGGTLAATGAAQNMRYNFTESVLGIDVTSGPSSGGTAVLISGNSFNTSAAAGDPNGYWALLTFTGSTRAANLKVALSVRAYNVLVLTTPSWGSSYDAGLLTIQVFHGVQLLSGPTLNFQMGLTLSAIQPTSAPATGGGVVEVLAHGLSPVGDYMCTFKLPKTNLVSVAKIFNATYLTCEVPSIASLSPSLVSTLSIIDRSSGSVLSTYDGKNFTTPFSYFDIYASLTPSRASAAGGTAITISGGGFDTSAAVSYQCVFSSSVTDYFLRTPARTSRFSTLVCSFPQWAVTASTVSVSVQRGDVTIAGSPLSLDVFQVVGCALLPAPADGSETLSLSGYGFNVSDSAAYSCRFRVDSATLTTPISVQSLTSITCRAASVGGIRSAVRIPLSIFYKETAVRCQSFDSSALSTLVVDYYPIVTGISPSTIAVDGSTLVTVQGSGFSSNIQYGCVVFDASGRSSGQPQLSIVSDVGRVVCRFGAIKPPPVNETSFFFNITDTQSNKTIAFSTANTTVTVVPPPIVTFLLPSEGPRNTTTSVTVSGRNFRDVSSVLIGGLACSQLLVVGDSSLTCVVPSGVGANVSILLITPRYRRDPDVTWTYLEPPPVVITTTASTSLLSVQISFDRTIALSEAVSTCEQIIHAKSLGLLGTNPDCAWSSRNSFTIWSTSLPLDTMIYFSQSVLFWDLFPSYPVAEGASIASNSVGSIDDGTTIDVIFPSKVCTCDTIQLSAASIGEKFGGGRTVNFQWRFATRMNLGRDLQSEESVFLINAASLPVGTVYVDLQVGDFIGRTLSTQISFLSTTLQVPSVTIAGPTKLSVPKGSAMIRVDGRAELSSCTPAKSVLAYQWSAVRSREGVSLIPSGTYSTGPTLVLPLSAATVGVPFNVTLLAYVLINGVASPTLRNTATVEVTAMSLPPTACIVGGGAIVVDVSSTFVVDASCSVLDPDLTGVTTDVVFNWRCESTVGATCGDLGFSATGTFTSRLSRITVQSNTLDSGANYTLTLKLTKAGRSSANSATVTLVSVSNVTTVGLGATPTTVNPNGLYLVKGSSSSGICNWKLSLVSHDPAIPPSAIGDACTFILSSSILARLGGRTLALRLQGPSNVPGVAAGWAVMSVYVNRAPSLGTFTVSPTRGKELETVFSLKVSGWSDSEGNLPLQYRFEVDYARSTDPFILQSWSLHFSEWQLRLPYTNSSFTSVVAVVADALGAESRMSIDVPLAMWTGPLVLSVASVSLSTLDNILAVGSWIQTRQLTGSIGTSRRLITGRSVVDSAALVHHRDFSSLRSVEPHAAGRRLLSSSALNGGTIIGSEPLLSALILATQARLSAMDLAGLTLNAQSAALLSQTLYDPSAQMDCLYYVGNISDVVRKNGLRSDTTLINALAESVSNVLAATVVSAGQSLIITQSTRVNTAINSWDLARRSAMYRADDGEPAFTITTASFSALINRPRIGLQNLTMSVGTAVLSIPDYNTSAEIDVWLERYYVNPLLFVFPNLTAFAADAHYVSYVAADSTQPPRTVTSPYSVKFLSVTPAPADFYHVCVSWDYQTTWTSDPCTTLVISPTQVTCQCKRFGFVAVVDLPDCTVPGPTSCVAGHGTCNLQNYQCTCVSGWAGPRCEIPCRTCSSEGGTCSKWDGSCICKTGYAGPDCSVNPTFSSVSPSAGPTLGGTKVTLVGNAFGNSDTTPSAFVSGVPCAKTSWISKSTIECVVPRGTGQRRRFTAIIFGITVALEGAYSYFGPSISGITTFPPLSETQGNSVVNVSGSNFGQSSPRVFFGQTEALSVEWISDSLISCRTPTGSGASVSLSVTVEDQTTTRRGLIGYFPPIITEVRGDTVLPQSWQCRNCTITLLGTNLGGAEMSEVSVTVGGRNCVVVWASYSLVTCLLESGAGDATVIITVNGQVGVWTDSTGNPVPYKLLGIPSELRFMGVNLFSVARVAGVPVADQYTLDVTPQVGAYDYAGNLIDRGNFLAGFFISVEISPPPRREDVDNFQRPIDLEGVVAGTATFQNMKVYGVRGQDYSVKFSMTVGGAEISVENNVTIGACDFGQVDVDAVCVCAPGFGVSPADENQCAPCPAGTYSDRADRRACTSCPDKNMISDEKSMNVSDCRCAAGYWRIIPILYHDIDTGIVNMVDLDGNPMVIRPDEGSSTKQSQDQICVPCYGGEDSCDEEKSGYPNEKGLIEPNCKPGQSGVLCGVCAGNFVKNFQTNACIECPSDLMFFAWLATIIGGSILVGILLKFFSAYIFKLVPFSQIKLIVGYAIVVSSLEGAYSVPVSVNISYFFQKIMIFQRVNILNFVRCISKIKVPFYTQVVVQLLQPVFIFAVYFLAYLALRAVRDLKMWLSIRRKDQHGVIEARENFRRFHNRVRNFACVCVTIVHPSVANSVFGMWRCLPVTGYKLSFLKLDLEVECHNSKWRWYTGMSTLWGIFFVLGTPLLIYYVLWRVRRELVWCRASMWKSYIKTHKAQFCMIKWPKRENLANWEQVGKPQIAKYAKQKKTWKKIEESRKKGLWGWLGRQEAIIEAEKTPVSFFIRVAVFFLRFFAPAARIKRSRAAKFSYFCEVTESWDDLSFLHDEYKFKYYWWEAMETIRRAAIVSFVTVMGEYLKGFDILTGLSLTFLFLVIHVALHPYLEAMNNTTKFWIDAIEFVSLFSLVVATLDTETYDSGLVSGALYVLNIFTVLVAVSMNWIVVKMVIQAFKNVYSIRVKKVEIREPIAMLISVVFLKIVMHRFALRYVSYRKFKALAEAEAREGKVQRRAASVFEERKKVILSLSDHKAQEAAQNRRKSNVAKSGALIDFKRGSTIGGKPEGSRESLPGQEGYNPTRDRRRGVVHEQGTTLFGEDFIMLVMSARRLPKMDLFGLSDPYLVFSSLNSKGERNEVSRTEVAHVNLNPDWNPIFLNFGDLAAFDDEKIFVISCYDEDIGDEDDLIGEIEISLSDLLSAFEGKLELKLKRPKVKKNLGVLVVRDLKIGCQEDEEDENAPEDKPGTDHENGNGPPAGTGEGGVYTHGGHTHKARSNLKSAVLLSNAFAVSRPRRFPVSPPLPPAVKEETEEETLENIVSEFGVPLSRVSLDREIDDAMSLPSPSPSLFSPPAAPSPSRNFSFSSRGKDYRQ